MLKYIAHPSSGRSCNEIDFFSICIFLDFSDNDLCGINDPQCDRLHKIRPFLDMLKANCASVFSPDRDLCVHESLVLFKGKVAFKQYIRTKRARFGLKLF